MNNVTKMGYRHRLTGADLKKKSSLPAEIANGLLLALCLVAMGALWMV